MTNAILHKFSSVTTVVPAAGSLTPRELALNTADGRLFTKTDAGAVVEFARKDAVPSGTGTSSGTNTGDQTNISGTAGSISGFNNPTTAATANTTAYRDSAGDIALRLLRPNYADQTTISGAIAYRVNSSTDNYVRFCSDTGAIRTFLGLGSVNNTADTAKPVSTLQQTALNLKADAAHKYHSFANGQYFYDNYEGSNYFRLFTDNAMSDTIRFGAITSPEYYDYVTTNTYVAWAAGTTPIQNLLDGREDTGLDVSHVNRNFRFIVTRSTGYPTTALLLLQSVWTAISYPGMTVTIETSTSAAGPWVVKDTAVLTSANTGSTWGSHVKCTSATHNGENYMRITVAITDWVDSGGYTTVPLRRISFFSNYQGATQQPWTWNYAKVVNFAATPTALGTALVLTNDSRLVTPTTVTGNAGRLDCPDTRAVVDTPQSFTKGLEVDFKTNTTDGLADGGTYHGVITIRQYASGSDWSGGGVRQVGFTDNHNMWLRGANADTTWSAWRQVAFTNSTSFTGAITAIDINGGTVDGTPIGGAAAAAGNFTTLGATGAVTVSGGSISAPSISSTTGTADTGVFFPTTDNLGLVTNGVERIRIDSAGTFFRTQADPSAIDVTTSLTITSLYSQIITSTTAAAVSATLPTGTSMETMYSAAINMAFEWSVINTGPNAFTVITNTGHLVWGSMVVATGTSGSFKSRRIGTNSWVTYRIG